MKLLGSTLFIASHPPSRQAVLDYLAALGGFGLVRLSLELFWPCFLFSAVWLFWGNRRSWPASHYSLPLLVCAWLATYTLFGNWLYYWQAWVAGEFVAGVIAFVVVIALVSLAAWRNRNTTPNSEILLPLGVGFLSFATVALDFGFLMLVATPLPEQ